MVKNMRTIIALVLILSISPVATGGITASGTVFPLFAVFNPLPEYTIDGHVIAVSGSTALMYRETEAGTRLFVYDLLTGDARDIGYIETYSLDLDRLRADYEQGRIVVYDDDTLLVVSMRGVEYWGQHYGIVDVYIDEDGRIVVVTRESIVRLEPPYYRITSITPVRDILAMLYAGGYTSLDMFYTKNRTIAEYRDLLEEQAVKEVNDMNASLLKSYSEVRALTPVGYRVMSGGYSGGMLVVTMNLYAVVSVSGIAEYLKGDEIGRIDYGVVNITRVLNVSLGVEAWILGGRVEDVRVYKYIYAATTSNVQVIVYEPHGMLVNKTSWLEPHIRVIGDRLYERRLINGLGYPVQVVYIPHEYVWIQFTGGSALYRIDHDQLVLDRTLPSTRLVGAAMPGGNLVLLYETRTGAYELYADLIHGVRAGVQTVHLRGEPRGLAWGELANGDPILFILSEAPGLYLNNVTIVKPYAVLDTVKVRISVYDDNGRPFTLGANTSVTLRLMGYNYTIDLGMGNEFLLDLPASSTIEVTVETVFGVSRGVFTIPHSPSGMVEFRVVVDVPYDVYRVASESVYTSPLLNEPITINLNTVTTITLPQATAVASRGGTIILATTEPAVRAYSLTGENLFTTPLPSIVNDLRVCGDYILALTPATVYVVDMAGHIQYAAALPRGGYAVMNSHGLLVVYGNSTVQLANVETGESISYMLGADAVIPLTSTSALLIRDMGGTTYTTTVTINGKMGRWTPLGGAFTGYAWDCGVYAVSTSDRLVVMGDGIGVYSTRLANSTVVEARRIGAVMTVSGEVLQALLAVRSNGLYTIYGVGDNGILQLSTTSKLDALGDGVYVYQTPDAIVVADAVGKGMALVRKAQLPYAIVDVEATRYALIAATSNKTLVIPYLGETNLYSITLRIVDASTGRLVPATITMGGMEYNVSSGVARIPVFMPGEYRFRVYADGYKEETVTVLVNDENPVVDATVRLEPITQKILVKAVDSNGDAVEGATVAVMSAGRLVKTTSPGELVLRAGEYTIIVQAPPGYEPSSRTFNVTVPGAPGVIVAKFAPVTGSICVTVSAGGNAGGEANVTLYGATGEVIAATSVELGESVCFNDLPLGVEYTVNASMAGYGGAAKTILLTGNASVELVLEPAACILEVSAPWLAGGEVTILTAGGEKTVSLDETGLASVELPRGAEGAVVAGQQFVEFTCNDTRVTVALEKPSGQAAGQGQQAGAAPRQEGASGGGMFRVVMIALVLMLAAGLGVLVLRRRGKGGVVSL